MLTYSFNTSSFNQILAHLRRVDKDFKPPLHTYTDIFKYAEKISNNAIRIEIFKEKELVGLMALYYNETDKYLYATNFSLERKFRGSGPKLIIGIASFMRNQKENLSPEIIEVNELIMKSIEKIEKTDDFKLSAIHIELQHLNAAATSFYKKLGFREVKTLNKASIYLILDL